MKYEKMDMCKIYGSEVSFNMDIPEVDIVKTCKEIWDNPEKYSDYKNGSDAAYYSFLKFLWVKYPDGRDVQLASIALEDE